MSSRSITVSPKRIFLRGRMLVRAGVSMYGYDGFDDYGFHPAIVGGGGSKPEKDAEKQAGTGRGSWEHP